MSWNLLRVAWFTMFCVGLLGCLVLFWRRRSVPVGLLLFGAPGSVFCAPLFFFVETWPIMYLQEVFGWTRFSSLREWGAAVAGLMFSLGLLLFALSVKGSK